jgi:hypothetical protein
LTEQINGYDYILLQPKIYQKYQVFVDNKIIYHCMNGLISRKKAFIIQQTLLGTC